MKLKIPSLHSVARIILAALLLSACSAPLPVDYQGNELQKNYNDLLVLSATEIRIDKNIGRSIRDVLQQDERLQDIKVYVHNGVVLLIGPVSGEVDAASFAGSVASVRGVKVVHNYTEPGGKKRFLGSIADSWTGFQLRLHLAELPHALQSRVRLISYKGHIYIMGLIRSYEKKTLGTAIGSVDRARKLILLAEIVD
ncbi:MAG: BON domain-containing protein [Gammaproteobacteria bacterium]